MSNPKEAAKLLLEKSREANVRFPKVWDESKLTQTCGATVMLHRSADGFDIDAALENLIEKYGQEEPPSTGKVSGKKRKSSGNDAAESKEEDDEDKPKKGPKKTEIMAEERNRPVAEAIKEMADIYFKNKDARKGGVFSKGAKAIRECDFYISTAKEAMTLKGVGKGIAGYVEEMLQTGSIQKLEELRAGTA